MHSAIEYEIARDVQSLGDCYFYHMMDLPGLGCVGSCWDIRHCVDDYLGNCDFGNKRVLDVGAASGYLTFELESRGAQVVSFDMPSAENWDFVPHVRLQPQFEDLRRQKVRSQQQLQNAYWYAHRRVGSSAKAYYGDIYHLPPALGNFDTVFMGMVIGHLRDPFQAIHSASQLCGDTMIITTQMAKRRFWKSLMGRRSQEAFFLPAQDNVLLDAWWILTEGCIKRMLGTVGFDVVASVPSYPKCSVRGRSGRERCVSIVARRVAGQPVGLPLEEQAISSTNAA